MSNTMLRLFFRMITRRSARQLRQSLLALPKDLMEPLRLQIVNRYNVQDIAQYLKISEEEALHRIRRARATVFGIVIE